MQSATRPASSEALADAFSAALDWWREAGVDGDWRDAPASWLAPPGCRRMTDATPHQAARQPAPARPEAPPPPEPRALDLPDDLESFAAWWMHEPGLDNGRVSGRVPPRGPRGAALMVLVPEPEREDEDSGTLLSGPDGQLLRAMLDAMQVAPESVYFASILPRHTPHADWAAARQAGLGEVLARHVALAAPQRLIAFTGSVLSLLGHDPANNPDFSREFNHGGQSVPPLLAARELAAMRERWRWKAGFWRSWLDWTAAPGLSTGAMETERT